MRRQAGPTCSSQETDFSLLNVYLVQKSQKLTRKTQNQERRNSDHIMNMNTDECDDTDELIAAEVKGDRQTSPETAKIQFYFLNVLRKKNLFSDLPSLQ